MRLSCLVNEQINLLGKFLDILLALRLPLIRMHRVQRLILPLLPVRRARTGFAEDGQSRFNGLIEILSQRQQQRDIDFPPYSS